MVHSAEIFRPMLYLMAAYGLRSCEVVALTLDDIDWRAALIRIPQRKSKRHLILPLTDDMGDVLQHYLQEGRQCSPPDRWRELFLCHRAPRRPLTPQAMREIFNEQIRRSGLEISLRGSHSLRHASALRLMHHHRMEIVRNFLLFHARDHKVGWLRPPRIRKSQATPWLIGEPDRF